MHLDIHLSRYIAKTTYLEKPKCLIIWNGGIIILGYSVSFLDTPRSGMKHSNEYC